MVLVDTSVWVDVFRDKSGETGKALERWLDDRDIVLSRFNQLELLQGCRDEKEWSLLAPYLDSQDYLEVSPTTWPAAARIYFDLRRKGLTVRSPIDCCIAQLGMEHKVLLLHNDVDFETIASVRPLQQSRWSGGG
ncbi:MAG: PIN domain nuclease [Gammaproteobacteria bacterium]|nr:PIN domain nuclease [Gammaproteobacteria bacterium]